MKHEEDNLQSACVRWFSLQFPKFEPFLIHIPNEGKRSWKTGKKLLAMGMRRGAPDLVLLIPNRTYPFLCIEMKTPKGRQSPEQKEYEMQMTMVGAKYLVVRSFDEFRYEILKYVKDI